MDRREVRITNDQASARSYVVWEEPPGVNAIGARPRVEVHALACFELRPGETRDLVLGGACFAWWCEGHRVPAAASSGGEGFARVDPARQDGLVFHGARNRFAEGAFGPAAPGLAAGAGFRIVAGADLDERLPFRLGLARSGSAPGTILPAASFVGRTNAAYDILPTGRFRVAVARCDQRGIVDHGRLAPASVLLAADRDEPGACEAPPVVARRTVAALRQ